MAERALFFNAMEIEPDVFDREYQAQDFAEYFDSVLSTGLLHTNEVPGTSVSVESGTLNTIISPGKAIMRGQLYKNTTPLTLTHSIPEPTLDRIDRIVLRLNLHNTVRDIKLRVLEGEPSENPVAPELIRTQFIHDISLAQIRVRANTVQLLPSDLVDERLKEDLCGLVYSLISIPTSQFQEQWDLFFANKTGEINQVIADFGESAAIEEQKILNATAEFVQMVIDAESQLQLSLAGFEQQWNDWFSHQQTEGFVMASEKGAADGVATLDSSGLIPPEQIPSMDYIPTSEKGQPNGVAELDENASIPSEQLGNVQYLKDFYGRKTQGFDINKKPINELTIQGVEVELFNFPPITNHIKELFKTDANNYTSISNTEVMSSSFGKGGYSVLSSVVPYDLTKVNSVEFKYRRPLGESDGESLLGFQKAIDSTYSNYDIYSQATVSGDVVTISIDVSSLTGLYYLKISSKANAAFFNRVYISGIKFTTDLFVKNDKYSPVVFKDGVLSGSFEGTFTITPNFLDWFSLNALVDTPNGTNAKFDIYDNHDNLLKSDVKNGDTFKNFTNPNIKVLITLSRDSLETPSPIFNWLEIGMRGISKSGQWERIADVILDDITAQIEFADLGLENYRLLKLECQLYSTTSALDGLGMRFNNDARNGGYSHKYGFLGSTSITSLTSTNRLQINNVVATSGDGSICDIIINNSVNRKKVMQALGSAGRNDDYQFSRGNWNNIVDLINTISIYPFTTTTSFVPGTKVTLSGVR